MSTRFVAVHHADTFPLLAFIDEVIVDRWQLLSINRPGGSC